MFSETVSKPIFSVTLSFSKKYKYMNILDSSLLSERHLGATMLFETVSSAFPAYWRI